MQNTKNTFVNKNTKTTEIDPNPVLNDQDPNVGEIQPNLTPRIATELSQKNAQVAKPAEPAPAPVYPEGTVFDTDNHPIGYDKSLVKKLNYIIVTKGVTPYVLFKNGGTDVFSGSKDDAEKLLKYAGEQSPGEWEIVYI